MKFNRLTFRIAVTLLVITVVASYGAYWRSITILDSHIQEQIEVTNHLDNGERFHSSIHSMLMAVEARLRARMGHMFQRHYQEQLEEAMTALDGLTRYAGHAGATDRAEDLSHITREIAADFKTFVRMTGDLIMTNAPDGEGELEKAKKLFDKIFRNYKKIHAHHASHREMLLTSTSQIRAKMTAMFLVQILIGVIITGAVLFFLDRVVLKIFTVTEELALKDQLTGLYNRHALKRMEDNEIRAAIERGLPFGVLLADIDHFKRFNDTHGHPAGDKLLSDMGVLLSGIIRGRDRVFRYGGEEFLILLRDTDLEGSRSAARKIIHAIRDHTFTLPNGTTKEKITISMGLSVHPTCGGPFSAIVEQADRYLYMAKDSGRNRFKGPVEGMDKGRAVS